ncbi:hypothetical protein HHI36_005050 [Cryptolaemus montrouzieri]|uniref:Glucose-methanol-choline oxidoreductase N-terminal domain-containing protein n=1 Tax=Cryptolaemus montrouzieri TaxID=559131 RepID=A0ABD2NTW9_9CUCU
MIFRIMIIFISLIALNFCYIQCLSPEEKLESVIVSNIQNAKQYVFPKKNEILENISKNETENYGDYDFIIIGAGSAGSVLTNRLSEVRDWKILLLEAGGEEDDFTEVPDMMFWSLFSERNWGYYTIPQTTCCQGMRDKCCFYPRGKILGGTSSLNGLMYVRGNPGDFNHWEALGNTGWSYKDVLPYFKKSEQFSCPNHELYHGYDGPMSSRYAEPESPFYNIFARANEELGIHYTDYNGENQIGYSRIQFNQKEGKRVSSAKAFLKNLENRENVKISIRTFATKIILEDDSLRAKGVEFVREGKKYFASAKKEVIISAGAINSAQLLMLSGIGPKHDLEKLKIDVKKDLPVGKILQDHVNFFGLNFRTNLTETIYSKNEILKQFSDGKGDLTIPANDRAIGFFKTNKSESVPDIEYILVPPSTNPFGKPAREIFNANDQLYQSFLNQLNQSSDFTLFMIFLHPRSTGNVRLKSKHPVDFPLIDLKFFSDKENHDLNRMYQGIQFLLKLIKTKPFQEINPELITEFGSCHEFEQNTKSFWFCVLKLLATSSYHPISTTRMGISEKNSVVDPKLKVHGMEKLRVVDCGVFPSTTSGHPHAVAVMIGEKISDDIKTEYNIKF